MDETIDALSDRLAPRHLLDEAMGWLRGGASAGGRAEDAAAMARNVGKMAWRQVRRHPVPSALIGAGLAWMIFEGGNGRQEARIRRRSREPQKYGGSYVDARTGQPYTESYGDEFRDESAGPDVGEKAGQAWDRVREGAEDAAGSARESVTDAAEQVRQRAAWLRQRARERADRASHRARQGADTVNAYVTGAAGAAKHYAEEAAEAVTHRVSSGYAYSRQKLWDAVDEYPLAVGGAALGLGLMLGLAAPRTRREDQWMGETSDQFKQKARETGKELVDRGQHIAQATAAAVTDEARKQGLTPSGLKEHGRQFVEKVREDADEEGLTPGAVKRKVEKVVDRASDAATEEATGESRSDSDSDSQGA